MSDILLSVGLQNGAAETSQIQKDLQEIIKEIDKNPPKVKVGLEVDQKALANFRSELTKILSGIAATDGKSVKVSISGIGDIGSYAGAAVGAAKKASDAIKQQNASLKSVLTDYRAGLSLLNRNKNAVDVSSRSYRGLTAQINLFENALSTANNEAIDIEAAFVKLGIDAPTALNNMKTAMAAFRAEVEHTGTAGTTTLNALNTMTKSMNDLLQSSKGLKDNDLVKGSRNDLEKKLSSLDSVRKMVSETGVSVEDAFSKVYGSAANIPEIMESAKTAMSGFRRAVSDAGGGASNYEKTMNRIGTLIDSTRSKLDKWSRAKHGKSSSDYVGMERELSVLEELQTTMVATGVVREDADEKISRSTENIIKHSAAIKANEENTKSLQDRIVGLAEKFGSWLTVSQVIMFAVGAAKNMVRTVVDLDTSMTELKKVTDETDATYSKFLSNASDRAKNLGTSLSDVVSVSADFARLGFNIDESAKLADVALLYKNIGDGVESASQASESIVSTMQAFKIVPEEADRIVDVFNSVGNSFAVSSGGIGDALKRSAAAMNAAGNSLEETVALVAAANTVVQNPESVGEIFAQRHSNVP